tara:strand:- start:16933 stop:17358 length:426 start_codon:yes stop_codon:yes gene_type:complete
MTDDEKERHLSTENMDGMRDVLDRIKKTCPECFNRKDSVQAFHELITAGTYLDKLEEEYSAQEKTIADLKKSMSVLENRAAARIETGQRLAALLNQVLDGIQKMGDSKLLYLLSAMKCPSIVINREGKVIYVEEETDAGTL